MKPFLVMLPAVFLFSLAGNADASHHRHDTGISISIGTGGVEIHGHVGHRPAPPAPPCEIRVWVPGRYEWTYRTVRTPGRWVEVCGAPPVREERCETVHPYGTIRSYSSCSRPVRVERRVRRVWVPERTEVVKERVWVPGHWETRRRF